MRTIAVTIAMVLVGVLIPAEAIAAVRGRGGPDLPDLQQETPVPGADSDATYQVPPAPEEDHRPYEVTRATPPAAGTGVVIIGNPQSAQTRTLTAGAPPLERAGTLPVWLGPVDGTQSVQSATTSTATTTTTTTAAGEWTVTVADRATTEQAGVDGVLMHIAPTSGTAGPVQVAVSYADFEQLYGAGWGSRLKLIQFPECFLTTPETLGCSDVVELASDNSGSSDMVSATADPGLTQPAPSGQAATMTSSTGGFALVATAEASGDNGNYKATELQPSSTWTAGDSGGDFSYTYPMAVPPVATDLAPEVALGYSSQSVDGRTSATNNQASWIGDGWDYHPGYVERQYRGCTDDKSNGANNPEKAGDLCWFKDNAVLSLNGRTTPLVLSGGQWIPANDDGTRVEQKFGAVNGDDNGEYWVVTTPDGVKFHFGLNRLPGWTAGQPETNATFTVPVFGNHPGEPCHASAYASSSCTQAWRWNLDYVEDPFGNAMTAFYEKEINHYAKNKAYNTPVAYDRGGYLTRIEYGQRSSTLYTEPAPARVIFTTAERCLKIDSFDCDPAKLKKNSADAWNWPDTPGDTMCTPGTKCYVGGPTFWSRKRLEAVSTEVHGADGYRPADRWALKHQFLTTTLDTNPPLWLDSIVHEGRSASGELLAKPPIMFHAKVLPNRVSRPTDARPGFLRARIGAIHNETGGSVAVTYSAPCNPEETRPVPEANTSRCYPVYWSPDSADDPAIEWFNKYVVTAVTEEDHVGGAPPATTTYTYLGGAGWAKDDSELTQEKYRTYNMWRGYDRVQSRLGTTDPAQGTVQTLKEKRFFRGMHGDPLPGGTSRTITITDSTGTTIAQDLPQYQGMVAEEITYRDGSATIIDARTVTWPWSRETALQPRDGVPALKAYHMGESATESTQTISGGRTRTVRTETEYDQPTEDEPAYGLPVAIRNLGDIAVTGDEQCVSYTYAHNTTANIIGAPTSERVTADTCPAETSPVAATIKDRRIYYDNGPFGTAPVQGTVTMEEDIDAAGTGYVKTTRKTYDSLGRVVSLKDATDEEMTTQFTPASSGASPAQTIVRNPLGHTETTTFDSFRGQPVTVTDANDRTTRAEYDPLGRLSKVWMPDRSSGKTPTLEFNYEISGTSPTVVTSRTLRDNGTYAVSKKLMDGLLRTRQVQTEAVGHGRLITETRYNNQGQARLSTQPYYTDGEPGNALYIPDSDTLLRSYDVVSYDGMARSIKTETHHGSTLAWTSEVQHGGDYVVTLPPQGGIAQRAWSDAHGRVVKLDEFTNLERTAFTETTYEFDSRGLRSAIQGAAGNRWTYTYDIRGQQVSAVDPDAGTSTATYDDLGRRTTTTNATGTLATTYDAIGRKTSIRQDTANGSIRAQWTYDTLAKGQPTASIRWHNGQAYHDETTGYDTNYRPTGRRIIIPPAEGPLAGTYEYTSTYTEVLRSSRTVDPLK